jgi:hypothetical protein
MSLAHFAKITVLVALAALVPVGIVLAYYEWRGAFPGNLQVLLPVLYIGVIALLLRTGVVKIPDRYRQGPVAGRIVNLAKSMGCLLATALWAYVGGRYVPDSPVGAAILLVPIFAILGIGVFFFSKGISGRS